MTWKAHHRNKVGIVDALIAAILLALRTIFDIFPHLIRIFVNDERRCGIPILVLSKHDADVVRIVLIAGLFEAICAGLMDEISVICRVDGGGSRCRDSSQCSGDCYGHSLSSGAGHHGGMGSAIVVSPPGAKVELRFDDLPL